MAETCPACSRKIPDGANFCAVCGARTTPSSDTPTRVLPGLGTTLRGSAGAAGLSSSSSVSDVRFLPGAILLERYRIIGLLGKGGMGEVYRADDLKLGQPVALKFLPEILASDPSRVERFLKEVRTSLQVSHPNVCRAYDVGEVEGHHFLSMEYVDGEDLASLLRRVGHLPRDRAIQVARQICAGLAAAHEAGILHRDLKPANVLIDGRGRARITDFGLAGLAEEIQGRDVRSGTPQYMAPEQLAGKEVSVRSDVYSLGLVLYELFTGKQAFQASSAAELMRLQSDTTPESPSSFMDVFDPAVESVLLRCLDREPDLRPASALAVAAALPGGDPLAAALAAGETPSPEMVAQAGETEGMKPIPAILSMAVVLLGLAGCLVLASSTFLLPRIPMEKPVEALAVEARDLVRDLGLESQPLDSAHGWVWDGDFLNALLKQNQGEEELLTPGKPWDIAPTIRPAPVFFWYRQGPRHLVPSNFVGTVGFRDPPLTITGMVNILLDPSGRLLYLNVVPPQRDTESRTGSEPEWADLLEAAGLDPSGLEPVTPEWNPLVSTDIRAAWEGAYADQPDVPIRIEAGAYGGQPVYFEVITPWTLPARQQTDPLGVAQRIGIIFLVVIILLLLGGASFLARRNLLLGRGDRRGAWRLASFLFLAVMLRWVLIADHVPALKELGLLVAAASEGLFLAGVVWLLYMALEPYVRRLWPESLVTWTRLLVGRFRDPQVGRDILVGLLAGVVFNFVGMLAAFLQERFTEGTTTPLLQLTSLGSIRQMLGGIVAVPLNSLITPVAVLFLLLILRLILRRQWLAMGTAVLLILGFSLLNPLSNWISLLSVLIVWPLIFWVLFRFGFLAYVFLVLVANMFIFIPLTADLSVWYAGRSMFGVGILVALASYGMVVALRGRTLIRDDFLTG